MTMKRKMAGWNSDFLAKRKDIKVYDMSMHEYNFELEGEYCEADINNYFQSKEEKRQRELRDSKYKFWK